MECNSEKEYTHERKDDDNSSTNNTILILLLVGLPASGKSCFARKLCEKIKSDDNKKTTSVYHIEYDSIVESIAYQKKKKAEENDRKEKFTSMNNNDDEKTNEYLLESWRESRQVALDQLRSYLEEEEASISSSLKIIIIDDNMHLRSMRKSIYKQCQDYIIVSSSSSKKEKSVYLGIIYINTPLSICIQQNQTRPKNRLIPTPIIENMSFKLEPPDPSKASWEKNFIVVDTTTTNSIDEIIDTKVYNDWIPSLLKNSSPIPLSLKEEEVNLELLEQERKATRENQLHQYDQYTRKWVGIVAKMNNKMAGRANLVRKKLLSDLNNNKKDKQQQQLDSSSSNDDIMTIEVLVNEFCSNLCKLQQDNSSNYWTEQQTKLLHEKLSQSIQTIKI